MSFFALLIGKRETGSASGTQPETKLEQTPHRKTLKNPNLFFQRIGGEGEKLLVSERGGCRVFVCITQTLRVSNIFIIFAYGTRNSQQDKGRICNRLVLLFQG